MKTSDPVAIFAKPDLSQGNVPVPQGMKTSGGRIASGRSISGKRPRSAGDEDQSSAHRVRGCDDRPQGNVPVPQGMKTPQP